MIHVSDLSLADIEFLQAVKSINKNPNKYQETDRTEVAANTASIKRATDLTAEQVSYRMGGNQNSRGFEKGDNPLIKTYDPKPTDRGYAPRAVELTEAGWDILSEAQKVGSRLEGVTQEEIEQLHDKITRLEVKTNIQNYMIVEDYKQLRFGYGNGFIIALVNNNISAKLVNYGFGYKIIVDTGSSVDEIIIGDDTSKIAHEMVTSVVSQHNN